MLVPDMDACPCACSPPKGVYALWPGIDAVRSCPSWRGVTITAGPHNLQGRYVAEYGIKVDGKTSYLNKDTGVKLHFHSGAKRWQLVKNDGLQRVQYWSGDNAALDVPWDEHEHDAVMVMSGANWHQGLPVHVHAQQGPPSTLAFRGVAVAALQDTLYYWCMTLYALLLANHVR